LGERPCALQLHPVTTRCRLPRIGKTEARILYDDSFLYIGVELWDREPHRIVTPSL